MKRNKCAALLLALAGGWAQAQSITTAFPGEEYIAFAISSVGQDCKLIWEYETSVLTQGKYGTATAGKVSLPYGNGCPGVFPFAIGKYKWTGGQAALEDTFILNVKFPPGEGGWQPVPVTVKRAAVSVKSLSLEKGTAVLNLNAGVDTAGTITFDFETAGGAVSSQTTSSYYQPGSAVSVEIDRPKIGRGKYAKANVTWNTTSYRIGADPVMHAVKTTHTPSKPWNVLGLVRYSQYGVTDEGQCTAPLVQKWVVDSLTECNFSQALFKSDFLEFTSRNGTGRSSALGYIKPGTATNVATACAAQMPPDVPLQDIYVQVSSVTGACKTELKGGVSVATFEKNCKATETLVKSTNKLFQKRDVDDKCPACDGDFRGTEGHIDAFTNINACDPHQMVDLGNYWTLQQP
ncbi:MAG TPA: hypothetical protein VFY73_10865 [Ideonella sp.]|uniref:hypothetical protein n=1 Tax=Ideonella sp. TaxID=1929293 RepID=UPI002E334A90|nr:hypothetical protein [Ideonella sp.]HEX5684521.1 hypothetical protein [Ideonella sp.]